jgi:hypothetical protein
MGTHSAGGRQKVVLATFNSYDAAQHAVDVLARHDFPVQHVTIGGTGVRWEEEVIGRWSLGRALLAGAGTGGWIGLLIGLVFLIVSPWAGSAMAFAIVIGVVFGAFWGGIAYALRRQKFASVPAVVADRYDILADVEFADEARRVLGAALPAAETRREVTPAVERLAAVSGRAG